MKQRQANYELLRIIAMMMVITLHFLGKGNLLKDLTEGMNLTDYVAWILEAVSATAVNVYVLLSGYFLVEGEFKPKKIFTIWTQVLFYSLGIPILFMIFGQLPREDVTFDRILTWIFPILREHYWFATAYILMFVFSPLIGKAAKQLEKKQLQIVICILLLIYSVSKSILPINLAIDKGGYDVTWFICLYLVAAYLRLYGLPFINTKKKAFFIYALGVGTIFGLTQFYRFLYFTTGKIEDFISSPYQYNHILCLLSAVALFCFFGQLHWKPNKWNNTIICKVSSATFGVYLLHEHELLRNLWPKWMGADKIIGIGTLLYYWIGAVAVVFFCGIIVDFIRQGIVKWIIQKKKSRL